jgi:murein DD-endopeptidase MepM/ murein hydrolase activator NlpD
MHEGVDLLALVGEPLYAIADGRVVLRTDVKDNTEAHLYWNLAIHHFPLELGIVSHYIHTEKPLVNIDDVVA